MVCVTHLDALSLLEAQPNQRKKDLHTRGHFHSKTMSDIIVIRPSKKKRTTK